MKRLSSDIPNILINAGIYRLSQYIIGAKKARSFYVRKYICPRIGDKVLDIGCGIGDILEFLPHDVEYTGFDINQKYINYAIKKYSDRGSFLCKKVSKDAINSLSTFDIVMANGVLHHLTDDEAIELFKLAKTALKPSGRLITLDGCYTKEQSLLARFILSIDRGKHVRSQKDYLKLASKVFPNIKIDIRDDLLTIPYTHIIMECSL
ncbi:MAG: class I SAM-dependent methyltransferase [Nitrospirota bacterium]